MFIAGVDLAAEPKGSAISVLDFQPARATLTDLHVGATDKTIIGVASVVAKLGIDCALGWPLEFSKFISAQLEQVQFGQSQSSGHQRAAFAGDLDLRRRLAYRETDRQVRAHTGRWPLSVSTDRLAMTAIRAAGLLSQLAATGFDAARDGTGLTVEVYPAATLRQWGFEFAGYRAATEIRARLLGDLQNRAPWLNLVGYRDALIESCDAFDSLVAALATRAAHQGRYFKPSQDQLELARLEGWIALPNSPLEKLIEAHAS